MYFPKSTTLTIGNSAAAVKRFGAGVFDHWGSDPSRPLAIWSLPSPFSPQFQPHFIFFAHRISLRLKVTDLRFYRVLISKEFAQFGRRIRKNAVRCAMCLFFREKSYFYCRLQRRTRSDGLYLFMTVLYIHSLYRLNLTEVSVKNWVSVLVNSISSASSNLTTTKNIYVSITNRLKKICPESISLITWKVFL